MERKAIEPLSRDEAKARVRAAGDEVKALFWVWSYPKEATLAAFINWRDRRDISNRPRSLNQRHRCAAQSLSSLNQTPPHRRKRIYD